MSGLAALSLLLAAPAHAERPITYHEALEAALLANPALLRSELGRDQAESGWLSSKGVFDPNYDLTGYYTQSSQRMFSGAPESDTTSWGITNAVSGWTATGTTLSLSHSLSYVDTTASFFSGTYYEGQVNASVTQQLLRGLSLKYNMENVTLARRNYETSELWYEKARQDTLANAADAYWIWVYNTQLMRIATDSATVAEEALRVGRLKVEAGELAPVEQTRLEAALVQAQANQVDAHAAEEAAANALLLVMGESPEQIVIPATEVGDAGIFDDLDAQSAIEVAMSQNLDLLVSRSQLETAEMERKNANHARLPTLSATAELGRAQNDAATASEAMDLMGAGSDPSMMLRGNLSVPILNRASRGTAKAKAAASSSARVDLEELARSVSAQVEQQVLTLRASHRRIELADANLRLEEQTLRAEEALSEAGRAIQKDVLEARTDVDRARAEAAKARTDYRIAQVELLRLQGQLSPDLP